MAVAIPAIVAGAVKAAPTILAGISALGTASQLFGKYAPSASTVNKLFSSAGRKSAGRFFKSLTNPKKVLSLAQKAGDSIASGEALAKAMDVAQDVSTVIGALDNAGISNSKLRTLNSAISTGLPQAQALNDAITTSQAATVYKKLREPKVPLPDVGAPVTTAIVNPPAIIPEEIPAILVRKPRKKKAKNKITKSSRNNGPREYR